MDAQGIPNIPTLVGLEGDETGTVVVNYFIGSSKSGILKKLSKVWHNLPLVSFEKNHYRKPVISSRIHQESSKTSYDSQLLQTFGRSCIIWPRVYVGMHLYI